LKALLPLVFINFFILIMYTSKLPFYLELFKSEISTSYQQHEETFDPESFYGRFHILRCLFLADFIIKIYMEEGITIDQDMVYFTILFHDIAREGNGFDEWEEESSDTCLKFMMLNSFNEDYAFKTSQLILKNELNSLEGQILCDVDVLDYNRFFPIGFFDDLFDASRLKFGSKNDVSGYRSTNIIEELIKYAQYLVSETDGLNIKIKTEELIQYLFGVERVN
jgi:hypothetical protein